MPRVLQHQDLTRFLCKKKSTYEGASSQQTHGRVCESVVRETNLRRKTHPEDGHQHGLKTRTK